MPRCRKPERGVFRVTRECFIHSLKKDGHRVLAEAVILKKIGDNDYLAEYNGVKCHALFNPFVSRYYVDDLYGVVKEVGARGGGAR